MTQQRTYVRRAALHYRKRDDDVWHRLGSVRIGRYILLGARILDRLRSNRLGKPRTIVLHLRSLFCRDHLAHLSELGISPAPEGATITATVDSGDCGRKGCAA